MRRCGLCGKDIPDDSIRSDDQKTGRSFHVDCAGQIQTILQRRRRQTRRRRPEVFLKP